MIWMKQKSGHINYYQMIILMNFDSLIKESPPKGPPSIHRDLADQDA